MCRCPRVSRVRLPLTVFNAFMPITVADPLFGNVQAARSGRRVMSMTVADVLPVMFSAEAVVNPLMSMTSKFGLFEMVTPPESALTHGRLNAVCWPSPTRLIESGAIYRMRPFSPSEMTTPPPRHQHTGLDGFPV